MAKQDPVCPQCENVLILCRCPVHIVKRGRALKEFLRANHISNPREIIAAAIKRGQVHPAAPRPSHWD